MNDTAKVALTIVGTMVLLIVDMLLLIYTDMSISLFWVIIVIAIVLPLFPLVFVRGSSA